MKYSLSVETKTGIIQDVQIVPDSTSELYSVYYSGDSPPAIGSELSRTWEEKRLARYTSESDPLYMKYIGQIEDADQTKTDIAKDAWTDVRDQIRSDIPII